jgi:hypothetical protein
MTAAGKVNAGMERRPVGFSLLTRRGDVCCKLAGQDAAILSCRICSSVQFFVGAIRKMIWESSYWKEPLLDAATWLRRVRFRENTSEKTLVRIEKEIFLGFYSVRKLLETIKVSDATKKQQYELTWHQNIKPVDWLNNHKINDLYDLQASSQESCDIGFICNLFIHSYVFVIAGEDKLDGIYVASDRTKNKKLYFISIETILAILRLVGRDYPVHAVYEREPETGELLCRSS